MRTGFPPARGQAAGVFCSLLGQEAYCKIRPPFFGERSDPRAEGARAEGAAFRKFLPTTGT